jgi:hypothetical protein
VMEASVVVVVVAAGADLLNKIRWWRGL